MNKAVANKIEQVKLNKPGGRSAGAAKQTEAKRDRGDGARKPK